MLHLPLWESPSTQMDLMKDVCNWYCVCDWEDANQMKDVCDISAKTVTLALTTSISI